MKKASPWMEYSSKDGEVYCAFRHLYGTEGTSVSERIAFIEKTPRVRIRPWTVTDDYLNWCEGYKGSGPGCPISREWCDKMLILLGYELVS